MLTQIEQLAAHFTETKAEDIEALMLLRLIDRTSEEEDVTELSYLLGRDPVVSTRRSAAWIAAQDEARAKNPDPDYNDPEAWFHIGDNEFMSLDILQEMSEEERHEVRARVITRR
jgi:hypothetical protein